MDEDLGYESDSDQVSEKYRFEHRILSLLTTEFIEGLRVYEFYCSGCHQSRTITSDNWQIGFYACKVCPHIEFCNYCFHTSDAIVVDALSHRFLLQELHSWFPIGSTITFTRLKHRHAAFKGVFIGGHLQDIINQIYQ